MNRLFCWLTGGHKYDDSNLETAYIPQRDVYLLSNHCIKCGKRYVHMMETDRLFQEEMERVDKLMSFVPYGRGDNSAEAKEP